MANFFQNLLKGGEQALQNKVEQIQAGLSQAKMSYENTQRQISPEVQKIFNFDRIKQGASSAVKDVPDMFSTMFKNYKANLGIPEHLNDPINPNSALGKFGAGVMSADRFLTTAPGISDIGYKIPQKYGTDSGNLIGSGLQQTVSGKTSNIPFTKIPVSGHLVGPIKVGLGVLGLTPTNVIGDYFMEGAQAAATPVFGKESLATAGIGLAAGILVPGGEANDAKNALKFSEKLGEIGQKGLSELPKEERLAFLVHYGKDLLEKGFKSADIRNISAPKAWAILANDITPATWANRAANEASKVAEKTSPLLNGAKKAYQIWVNTRKAGDFQALIQKKTFQELDSQGMEGIINFQSGDKSGMMANVQKFFDTKYSELKANGIKFGYQENYLPQLWSNTREEIDQVFGKTLNRNPGFSFKKTIEDYATGIEKGLTPRFNNISELAASYEKTANKAIADHEFFSFLTSKKFIMPETKAPSGWEALDTDLFPRITTKIENKTYSGAFKAEPELAKLINNYLRTPEGPLASFAQLATRVKNIGLGGGIPGTAINYHGAVNILRRDLLASDNPVSAMGTLIRDVKWMVQPNKALDYVNSNLEDATKFAKGGLTISAEDWGQFTKEIPTNVYQKAEGLWNTYLGDPLFKKFLPAVKLDFAKRTYTDLLKSLPEEQAVQKASEIANNVFGGINLDQLGRSKETQNFMRALFLAPDWAETNLRIGAGIAKGVTHWGDAELKTYRTIAKNMVFNYLLENVANKLMSGHWMFENVGNNQTAIDTGTFDASGAKRYITTWGTAQDFVRVPYQIIQGIAQGNVGAVISPVTNRLSLPASAIGHLTSNQDFLGRKIYGKDNYGNPIGVKQQIGGVANEVLTGLGLPPQAKGAIDYLSGRSSGEQAIVQSIEAPIKYSGGPISQKQIDQVKNLKSVGLNGQEINNVMHSSSGSTPLTGSWLSNLFGAKETAPTDPLMIALQKEKDLSDRQTKVKDIFAMNLPVDKTSALLAKDNLGTYTENKIYMIKTLEIKSGAQPDYIKSLLVGRSGDNYANAINYLARADVLTTSITKYWNDNNQISDEQKKAIDGMIKQANGTATPAKPKKPKALPTQTLKSSGFKLKLNVPKFRPITPIRAPKLSKNYIGKTTTGGVLK